MAKESLTPEEKKERRKKQAKYLGIFCVSGFVFLFGTILVRDYRCKQDEKLRLSENRNKYYESRYPDVSRDISSQEFFSEMFMDVSSWYHIDSERSDELEETVKEAIGDLDIGVYMYNALRYVEVECQCDFSGEMSAYSEFLSNIADKLWGNGENGDIGVRLFSDDGSQVIMYVFDGKKYMDYFFVDSEMNKAWESVRNTNNLSEFKDTEYNEVVLDEKTVVEGMKKYGTIIPYISDELIKAYNDKEPIKIILKSDKYIGYDYLPEEQVDALVDENYNESMISDDGDMPSVGNSAEEVYEDEEVNEEVPETTFTPLSELDYNTKTDVYLSPEDYSEYCTIVEEKDLNYNRHVILGEAQNNKEDSEQYYESKSWVCLFGNQRMFNDIAYMVITLDTSNISYQLMYYLYQTGTASYDLSIGMESLIKNFS